MSAHRRFPSLLLILCSCTGLDGCSYTLDEQFKEQASPTETPRASATATPKQPKASLPIKIPTSTSTKSDPQMPIGMPAPSPTKASSAKDAGDGAGGRPDSAKRDGFGNSSGQKPGASQGSSEAGNSNKGAEPPSEIAPPKSSKDGSSRAPAKAERRSSQPMLSPQEAAADARKLMSEAKQQFAVRESGAAFRSGIAAYELLAPYSKDAECLNLLTALEADLRRYANAANAAPTSPSKPSSIR